jgi:hypothetical protein
VEHYRQQGKEFQTLCRMAKLWLRDGTNLNIKCSYMLELIMLKVWHESRHEVNKISTQAKYQAMFCTFLQYMADLKHTRVIFRTYYSRKDVPQRLTQGQHYIISVSDPTVNTLSREHIEDLQSAARDELKRSGSGG